MARAWWWEKTVEHLYVRRILSDAAFSIPLDGDVEAGVGDLITADHVGCTLIEFKKDKGTVARELDKYKLTPAQREAAGGHYAKAVQLLSPKLLSLPGALAHYIIFGEATPCYGGGGQLVLRHRQYGDLTDAAGDHLGTHESLHRAKALELLAYMVALSKCRQKDLTSMGGMVFVGVGATSIAAMTLTEFVIECARAKGLIQSQSPPQPTPPPTRRYEGPSLGR
ncbi:MAG: hypothetical protein AB7I22_21080 [Ramlibacter sp.]